MFLTQLSLLSTLLVLCRGGIQKQSFIRPNLDPNMEIQVLPVKPKFVRDSNDNRLGSDDSRPPMMDFMGGHKDHPAPHKNPSNNPPGHDGKLPPLMDFIGGHKDHPGPDRYSPNNPPGHHDSKLPPLMDFVGSHVDYPGSFKPPPHSSPGHSSGDIHMDFPGAPGGPGEPPGAVSCPDNPYSPPSSPLVDENTRERILALDRHLQIRAHKNAIYGHAPTNEIEPKHSMTLLNKTGEIFKKFCPLSVIPGSFINHVILLFSQLHNNTAPGRLPYTTDEEFVWIEKLLVTCEENVTDIKTTFWIDPKCHDTIIGNHEHKPICVEPAEKLNPANYDPLIDIVWRIFEMVHTSCFKHFQGYSRILHRYVMSIYDLFNLPIRQKWTGIVSKPVYYTRLLGPNYINYGENINKCVQHWSSSFPLTKLRLPRLHHPFLVRYGNTINKIFE